MKLVKFKTELGQVAYINPEHVTQVSEYIDAAGGVNKAWTVIYTLDRGRVTVLNSVEWTVKSLLKDAMSDEE